MSGNYDTFLKLGECINPRSQQTMISVLTTAATKLEYSTADNERRTIIITNCSTQVIYIGLTSTVAAANGWKLALSANQTFYLDPNHHQDIYARSTGSTGASNKVKIIETRAWKST